MAELAGISLYAYQTYERGTAQGQATNPRLATILAIAQVLGVSIEEMLPEVPRLTAKTVRTDAPELTVEQATEYLGDPDLDAARLTPSEKHLLDILARSVSAKEAAVLLNMTTSTIEDHIRRIRGKIAIARDVRMYAEVSELMTTQEESGRKK